MDAEGRLIKNEEKMAKVGLETMNVFPHQLTLDLRSYKVRKIESTQWVVQRRNATKFQGTNTIAIFRLV